MSEIVGIEVDGGEIGPDPDGGEGRRGAPKWGLPAAIAVVGVLVLAALATAVLPRLRTETDPVAAPVPPGTAAASEPDVPEPAPPPPSTAAAPGEGAAAAVVDPRVEAAGAALDAWGAFAATGDVGLLEGTFAPDGPQYHLLAAEAPALAANPSGGPPYAVGLADAAVVEEGDGGEPVVVAATVTWARPGEEDQVYAWRLVLRPAAAEPAPAVGTPRRWVLWTVRDDG